MPKLPKMTWKRHKAKWQGCDKCELSGCRDKLVLAKGTIPCDILFIGEAPGYSEDTVGKPFCGPAGRLLQQIINEALSNSNMDGIRFAFTNLVCCIPKLDGDKVHEPPKEAVQACYPRLQEFVDLCSPQYIVFVGRVAEKMGATLLMSDSYTSIAIKHPAAILRGNRANVELQCQRIEDELIHVFQSLVPF